MILLEANRVDLIRKEQASDNYKNSDENRYGHVFSLNGYATFDKVDYSNLVSAGSLTVSFSLKGKTDTYTDTIRFDNFLNNLRDKAKKENLTYNTILFALRISLDRDDLYLHCTCPDYKYRQAYHAYRNGYGIVEETIPSDDTNPNDTKGSMCKHLSYLLSEVSWLKELAKYVFRSLTNLKKRSDEAFNILVYNKRSK